MTKKVLLGVFVLGLCVLFIGLGASGSHELGYQQGYESGKAAGLKQGQYEADDRHNDRLRALRDKVTDLFDAETFVPTIK